MFLLQRTQALGNLYFAHKSVKELDNWNFLTRKWEPVDGKSIHTGNIESVVTKEKAKFPQNFFPEVLILSNINLYCIIN